MNLKEREYILNKRMIKVYHINKIRHPKTYSYIIKKNKIKSATIIQKSVRVYLKKLINDDKLAQTKDMSKTYINNTTLIGDDIENINDDYFYTVDNFAFDIREIYKNNLKNPYTNLPFSGKSRKQLERIIRRYKKNQISLEIKNNIPSQFELSSMISNFFSKLTSHNTYPNVDIFINYNTYELYIFMKFIFKFQIINSYINYYDKERLNKYYKDCEDTDDSSISEFKFYVIFLLNKILNPAYENIETVALIISESIMVNIIQAYRNREFQNITTYLIPEQFYNEIEEPILPNTEVELPELNLDIPPNQLNSLDISDSMLSPSTLIPPLESEVFTQEQHNSESTEDISLIPSFIEPIPFLEINDNPEIPESPSFYNINESDDYQSDISTEM